MAQQRPQPFGVIEPQQRHHRYGLPSDEILLELLTGVGRSHAVDLCSQQRLHNVGIGYEPRKQDHKASLKGTLVACEHEVGEFRWIIGVITAEQTGRPDPLRLQRVVSVDRLERLAELPADR